MSHFRAPSDQHAAARGPFAFPRCKLRSGGGCHYVTLSMLMMTCMCPVLMDRGLFFSSLVSDDNIFIFISTRPKAMARSTGATSTPKNYLPPAQVGPSALGWIRWNPISHLGARPSHRQDPVFWAWHGPGSPRSRQLPAVADPEGLLTMPCHRVLVPGDPRSRWETCSRGERGGKSWMDRVPGLLGLLNVRPEFCVQYRTAGA